MPFVYNLHRVFDFGCLDYCDVVFADPANKLNPFITETVWRLSPLRCN